MEYHVSANPEGREFLVKYLGEGGFDLVYESKNVLGFDNRAFQANSGG